MPVWYFAGIPAKPGLALRQGNLANYSLRMVPVGINATGTRRERDNAGFIEVPADKYWGAYTQRALQALPPSVDSGIFRRFISYYGYVKQAVTMMHSAAGRLPSWKTEAIVRAADDIIAGRLADQFPLPVWQAGSGRDTDANINEVLANRASQLLGAILGSRKPIDPTRDIAMAQMLGGTFTAAISIATVIETETVLVPCGLALAAAIERNPGRLPGNDRRLRAALRRLEEAEGNLHEIGVDLGEDGMTAEDWQVVVTFIAAAVNRPFIAASDGYSDREALDAVVAAMAAVRGLAIVVIDTAVAYAPINAQAEAVAAACMHAIGQDQIVAAAVQGSATGLMAHPLIMTSALNAIHSLGQACETMRRIVSSSEKAQQRPPPPTAIRPA